MKFLLLLVFVFAIYCGFDFFTIVDLGGWRVIIQNLRLPRALVVTGTGAILAISGLVIQNIFQNPLASPSILGFEALVVGMLVSFVLFGLEFNTYFFWGIYLFCFLVLIFSYYQILKRIRKQSPVNILLVGFSINALASAWSLLCSSLAKDKFETMIQIQSLTMGSFQGKTYFDAAVLALIAIFLFVIVSRRSFVIDMLTQGPEISTIQGLNTQRIYMQMLFLVAVSVTLAVTFGAALPFVGLIVPQLVRSFQPTFKLAIVPVAILGAVLSLFSDFAAQRILFPRELEAGILTALIGAPFFLWIMIRKRGLK